MTEASDRWAFISCDSCVWTDVCCSCSFPLIVSSVCLGGLKAVVTGMLLARSLSSVCSQHNDRMWCHAVSGRQAVWAEACWHLGCSNGQLPANEESLKSSVTHKTSGAMGSDGLFHSVFRASGYFSVNMFVKFTRTLYFWVFCELFDIKFCWMKGGRVCSFGIFSGELVLWRFWE